MQHTSFNNMIKKALFLVALVGCLSFTATAQRIAYVDISAVLESLPEYNQAQSDLDNTAAKWRQEIAQEYDKIKGMYNKYQAEQVLMSDDMRQQKEDEIMEAEKTVREMQKKKFGPEGALFKKRQDLVRPIQEKVYAAIEEYAGEKGYDFIFDNNGSTGMVFANPKYDKTDEVKSKLGIK